MSTRSQGYLGECVCVCKDVGRAIAARDALRTEYSPLGAAHQIIRNKSDYYIYDESICCSIYKPGAHRTLMYQTFMVYIAHMLYNMSVMAFTVPSNYINV